MSQELWGPNSGLYVPFTKSKGFREEVILKIGFEGQAENHQINEKRTLRDTASGNVVTYRLCGQSLWDYRLGQLYLGGRDRWP